MKKVLIITYYWPPAGGPGVQRILKFAKYLPQFGWQPLILTVKEGEFPAVDHSLINEIPPVCRVFKTSSWEPNNIYKKFTGKESTEPLPVAAVTKKPKNWRDKLARWIRLNIFIPDAKIGWKPFAVKEGKKIIKRFKPDIILSSSPPPTVHLIARKLSKWSGIPHIADFRDPWTRIYHYDNVPKTTIVRKLESYLENTIINGTAKCITVSKGFANLIGHPPVPEKFTIIPNGYDEEDIPPSPARSEKFTIAYAGKLNPQQNPRNLWEALGELIKNEKFAENFKLLFIGNIDDEIKNSLYNLGLDKYAEYTGYLPHHKALERLSGASMLLLINPDTKFNKGIIPGKLFEYLALHKPVLAISPSGSEIENILKETKMGQNFTFNDSPKEYILNFYEHGTAETEADIEAKIKKYSRANLTGKLIDIMEKTV